MGIRFSFIILGAILAGIGFIWVLGTTIAAFGWLQTFASIVLTLLIWSMDLVHPYFYLAISILICIVVGYAASWLFPPPARSLRGLTIHRQDAVTGTE